MASLVVLIAVVTLFGVIFGVVVAISVGIRQEDKRGPLCGQAPGWLCQGARWATGMHTARWA